MSKHTPGVWRPSENGRMVVTDADIAGDIICLVPALEESAEFWDANARLIAAAPKMLETLKWIHDCHRQGAIDVALERTIFDELEAVIAEAEGRK